MHWKEIVQIVGSAATLGFWICLLYARAKRNADSQKHEAGVQTLFQGRK